VLNLNDSKLFKLIKSLEFGNNLHISVVFLNNEGNFQTALPITHNFHERNVCLYFKSLDNQELCMRCRNAVLKKAIRKRKAFGGICVNGVYEYCKPVVFENRVVGVIFVGNIFPDKSNSQRLLAKLSNDSLLSDLEKNCSNEQCVTVAEVVNDYIKFLLREYNNSKSYNPLIENIKSHIEENLTYDFAVKDISEIFNYNEKYLGKLFKAKTGYSMSEYVNLRRIEISSELLINTELSITEIATKTGFNNVSYFNRVFKKLKGVTPTEYRN